MKIEAQMKDLNPPKKYDLVEAVTLTLTKAEATTLMAVIGSSTGYPKRLNWEFEYREGHSVPGVGRWHPFKPSEWAEGFTQEIYDALSSALGIYTTRVDYP